MKTEILKIALKKLSKNEFARFNKLNSEPYGNELALKISEKLIKCKETDSPPKNYCGKGIHFAHRDYCGIGIFYFKEEFVLSTVFDGYGPDSIIIIFDSEEEFIKWLANESDQGMSLYGKEFNNQTITKLRLDWYLEENYSPVWNSYCNYVSEKMK